MAPVTLDNALAGGCDGAAGITPAEFRSLLSPEDLADIDGLVDFIRDHLEPLCRSMESEVQHQEAIKVQILGEGLQGHRLEKLNRYETHGPEVRADDCYLLEVEGVSIARSRRFVVLAGSQRGIVGYLSKPWIPGYCSQCSSVFPSLVDGCWVE